METKDIIYELRTKRAITDSLCILSGEMTDTKISAENLFSLPICVIMKLTKSLALRERWRRSRRRGQMVAEYALSPAIAGVLPRGEPLDARNLRGVWALPYAFVIQRRNWR